MATGGQLVIAAEKAADRDNVMVLQSMPIKSRQDLPLTLVRYVECTKERVVLSGATLEGMFTTAPSMTQSQPKSVLCSLSCITASSRASCMTSGTHLLSLLNDILDLAKLDARMMELQFDALALRPLLESSLRMIRERAVERGITMSLDIADAVNTVRGDACRVQQIMLTLLLNVVKFPPDLVQLGLKRHALVRRCTSPCGIRGRGLPLPTSSGSLRSFNRLEISRGRKPLAPA